MSQWSPQQAAALDRVGRWINSKDKPFFQLAGYAGTGKTTLAKHLAASVDGRVLFAACTGKAAHVLAKSGASNVSTIHKLIYKPKDKSQQRLKDLETERAMLLARDPVPKELVERVERALTSERENLARPMFSLNTDDSLLKGAALCVVDEYSMIDEQMGADLMSYGVPILALGDPGQLPPVRGASFFAGHPDVLLTEIHRQAADNPIIAMSKTVREGGHLAVGDYGNCRVRHYADVPREALAQRVLRCDQLLVGRNATRDASNTRARDLLGRTSPYPQAGDKLICLRNNHEAGLLNGQSWVAARDAIEADEKTVTLGIEGDDAPATDVLAHKAYFEGGKPDHWDVKDAESFDYGYAMTVHKAQGSQWPDVLLLDEWNGRDRRQWLYTGLTRASERIDIVVM